ncbi:MAG: hypothetical protein KGJ35_03250 [Patescibacteria group bacterium]|nr:hypothetical protein [Patescibacteria group bacterium]
MNTLAVKTKMKSFDKTHVGVFSRIAEKIAEIKLERDIRTARREYSEGKGVTGDLREILKKA